MLKILLYPISFFYGIAVYFRNRMYDLKFFKSTEFEIPVISVGNITVGGTGKTPHVEYLVNLLQKDFKLAVLSRGYKRKTKGFGEVLVDSTVADCGDEPLQIKRKFPQVGVFVDEKRVHGIEEIMRLYEAQQPDLILLDDAFQHRQVSAGINILLIDYNRPISEDRLLPLGRLREGKTQVRRATMMIYTKCPREVTPINRRIIMKNVNLRPYQDLYFTTLEYDIPRPVFAKGSKALSESLKTLPSVLLMTGIAQPEPLKKHIATLSKNIEELHFPDHHFFTSGDLQQIVSRFDAMSGAEKIIITTEKDAIRLRDIDELPEVLKENIYYIPVKTKFLDSEGKSFDQKIVNYVRENKSNRDLYKRKNQYAR